MQLFTQLWPAVIEILSTVLCDDCGNEFNMAVIFELTTSRYVQERTQRAEVIQWAGEDVTEDQCQVLWITD